MASQYPQEPGQESPRRNRPTEGERRPESSPPDPQDSNGETKGRRPVSKPRNRIFSDWASI